MRSVNRETCIFLIDDDPSARGGIARLLRTAGHTIKEFESVDAFLEPTLVGIARVIAETVPLSRLMAEQIKALRAWSRGRARCATSRPDDVGSQRRISA